MRIWLFLFIMIIPQGIQAKENYILYHKKILNCEQQFLYYDNITAALAAYRSVFEEYSKPFAKDCFVAAQLACFAGDKESATYFFRLSFSNGVTKTAILMSPAIKRLFDNDLQYRDEVETIYKEVRPEYQQTIDKQLRSHIIDLKERDNAAKWKINYNILSPQEALRAEANLDGVIEANTTEVVRLTHKYGFLSDRKIGFQDYFHRYDEVEEGRRDYCYNLVALMEQQYYHHPCCFFMSWSEMDSALVNGEILPGLYAVMYEWAYLSLGDTNQIKPVLRAKAKVLRARREFAFCSSTIERQTKYYNICPMLEDWEYCKDEKYVNECRREIGMGSIDHYRRRKKFQEQYGVKLLYGMFRNY